MGLIQVAVTKRNDNAFSKTYGLNTEKIVDFYKDGSDTVLWYVENGDRRRKPIKYVTSLTMAELRLKFAQNWESGADTDFLRRRLNLSATHRGINNKAWDVNINLDANRITHVWDEGSDTYVEFDVGGFGIKRIKVTETLAQVLEEAGSASAIATP